MIQVYTFFGDNMKEILKKAMVPIFLSIVCGAICGQLVYKIYLGNTEISLDGNLIYLLQSGEYSSYDNMRANTIGYDYVYYKEDDVYKTIIGVTMDANNIDKIKNVYGNKVVINKYFSNDSDLNTKLNEFDELLISEEDNGKIQEIVVKMLNLYKQDNGIRLTKVS